MSFFFSAGLRDAIPDSEADQKLVHRWVLTDDDDSLGLEDSVGDSDGTNNGVSVVTDGDYAAGAAGQGDGTDDYVDVGQLGDFGSSFDGTWAIAFSINTTDTRAVMGSQNSGLTFRATLSDSFEGDQGHMNVIIRDSDSGGDFVSVASTETINDGSNYRVVINKSNSGSSASDFEIYINQSEGTNTNNDEWNGSSTDFQDGLFLWAVSDFGSDFKNLDGIVDDVCFFDDGLTESEAQSYENPWD